MNKEDIDKDTAYHEAGHAVMCYLYRRPFGRVTIIEEGDAIGRVHFHASRLNGHRELGMWMQLHPQGYALHLYPFERPGKPRTGVRADIMRAAERHLMIAVAGIAAENIRRGLKTGESAKQYIHESAPDPDERDEDEDDGDTYSLWIVARSVSMAEAEAGALLDYITERAFAVFASPPHWQAVASLAAELLTKGSVSSRRAREIISGAIREGARAEVERLGRAAMKGGGAGQKATREMLKGSF